ncbi:Imm32 family immunity protein [Piscinibacter terrae]|uniref:Uncharacterized protein n=1 Tax=Piscinibacter terrae TaxID=2496871 RepID=A0A3N7HPQ0_9BURK|nr:hypothetical protein [Albitalea terrae]RQP24177.1 hypothetical protein DZC73_12715 [Albitalea terrae]
MKLYGCANEGVEVPQAKPKALAEITLCASPQELRRMAAFLQHCAAEMDRMGESYDHIHLGDHMKEFDQTSPHLVVFRNV